MDDDLEVIISSDSEGNTFKGIAEPSEGLLFDTASSRDNLDVYNEDGYKEEYGEEYGEEPPDTFSKCSCIWPV